PPVASAAATPATSARFPRIQTLSSRQASVRLGHDQYQHPVWRSTLVDKRPRRLRQSAIADGIESWEKGVIHVRTHPPVQKAELSPRRSGSCDGRQAALLSRQPALRAASATDRRLSLPPRPCRGPRSAADRSDRFER